MAPPIPTSFVLTKTIGNSSTFTAMSDKAEISEFDIKPNGMTLICTKPLKTSACYLNPGYNTITHHETVHKLITYMLENHSFPNEQKSILKKSF